MRMTFTVLTLLTALGLLVEIGLPISAAAQSYNWTGFYAGAQAGFAKPKDFVRYGGSSTGAPFDSLDQTISHRENGFRPWRASRLQSPVWLDCSRLGGRSWLHGV